MYDLFSSLKCKHCTYQSKSIFATSALVFTRRTDLSSFQRSHWSPIHILLRLLNLAFDSLFRCFLSESVNLLFGPRFELFFHWQQSQYACVAFKFNRGRMNTENLHGNYCMTATNSRDLFSPLLYSNGSWNVLNKFELFYH